VAEWFCSPSWQGTGDGCDCECGAHDPDCDADVTPFGCGSGEWCDSYGHCTGACAPHCDGKVCGDDGCGGVFGGCEAAEFCHEGQCVTGWFCNPAYQGSDDGCDCECGAYDPDCDQAGGWLMGCESWQTCDATGHCTPEACPPQCADKTCGDDGCGGSCGGCPLDLPACVDGACVADPCHGFPEAGCCDGDVLKTCGFDGLIASPCGSDWAPDEVCGWRSSSALGGEYACGSPSDPDWGVDPAGDPSGEHPLVCPPCSPACVGQPCGQPDGCGGLCACPPGLHCVDGQCFACTPDCYARECGDDGCGGSCGACGEGEVCASGQCCATACDGKECGTDGCGGSCGACAGGACVDGACVDSCGGLTFEGCCDGETMRWCSNGVLSELDCAQKPLCGWSPEGYYDCGTDGAADPAGTFAKECGAFCVPNCAGKECGHDGCGGECGACGVGQACSQGLCETPASPDEDGEVVAPDVTGDVPADVPAVDPGTDLAPDAAVDEGVADVSVADAPAADPGAAPDTGSTPDDDGLDREGGGGGGCVVGDRPASSVLVLLVLLLGLYSFVTSRKRA
jgi:hypothetical protein